MPQLLLYGTIGCHLCDEAEQLIREILPLNLLDELRIIDIIDNDKLYDHYHLTIPVLTIQPQNIELSWPFTKEDLKALLKQANLI